MREPWEVFASVLTVALGAALIATIVLIGVDIAAITRADGGAMELERWRSGIREEAVAETGGSSGAAATVPEGIEADRTGPLVAIVLFALIPIVAYAAGLVSFARRQRWSYVVMTALQLALLLAVAVPTLVSLF